MLTSRSRWCLNRHRRPPGGGRPRREPIGYRLGLPDKRLVRQQYDLRERQLKRALHEAARRGGNLGEKLVQLLEQRIDTLVWRAGYARSLREARHLIRHNNFTVDGRKMNRPSYELRPGQRLEIPEGKRNRRWLLVVAAQRAGRWPLVPYLDVCPDRLRATLTREPGKQEVPGLGGAELRPVSTSALH
jgi:small subunit ribosomal protein S4